jgi:hypothetical protein
MVPGSLFAPNTDSRIASARCCALRASSRLPARQSAVAELLEHVRDRGVLGSVGALADLECRRQCGKRILALAEESC